MSSIRGRGIKRRSLSGHPVSGEDLKRVPPIYKSITLLFHQPAFRIWRIVTWSELLQPGVSAFITAKPIASFCRGFYTWIFLCACVRACVWKESTSGSFYFLMTFYWVLKLWRTKASDFTDMLRNYFRVAVLYKAWSGHRWVRENYCEVRRKRKLMHVVMNLKITQWILTEWKTIRTEDNN